MLALFSIAVFCPKLGQRAAILGFIAGLTGNLLVWGLLPGVSWLWWSVAGFAVAWSVALLTAIASGVKDLGGLHIPPVPRRQTAILLAMSATIALFCLLLDITAARAG